VEKNKLLFMLMQNNAL